MTGQSLGGHLRHSLSVMKTLFRSSPPSVCVCVCVCVLADWSAATYELVCRPDARFKPAIGRQAPIEDWRILVRSLWRSCYSLEEYHERRLGISAWRQCRS